MRIDWTRFVECHQPVHTNEFSLACHLPRFRNDEAMSNELAGYFYFTLDKKDTALQYFLRAHEKYHDWGAIAKCNALFEFVQTALGSMCIATKFVSSSNANEALQATTKQHAR